MLVSPVWSLSVESIHFWASSAESVGEETPMGLASPGFSAGIDAFGGPRLSYLQPSPGIGPFLGMNSHLPSRLHLRFASIYRGGASLKVGGETLLSSRSRARLSVFPPTNSAGEPFLVTTTNTVIPLCLLREWPETKANGRSDARIGSLLLNRGHLQQHSFG